MSSYQGSRGGGNGAYGGAPPSRGGPARKQPTGRGGGDMGYGQEQPQRQFFPNEPPRGSNGGATRGSPPQFFSQPQSSQQSQQRAQQRQGEYPNAPPPKPPATQLVKNLQGLCSIWPLTVEPGKKAYRYDVDIERMPMQMRNGTMDKGKSLVKGSDDGLKALNRNLCFELIGEAYRLNNKFDLRPGHELVYDCRQIIYTSMPMKMFDMPGGRQIILANAQVNDYIKTYCGSSNAINYSILVRRNEKMPELDLNNLEQYARGESVFREDRSLRTFFELVTQQFTINREIYVPIGAGKLFEMDQRQCETVGNGMMLRKGIAKGVRVIRNDGKNPQAALVIDTKVAAFFTPQHLSQTVLEILPRRNGRGARMADFSRQDWARVEHLLDGLRVEVEYRRTRTFELGRLTDRPVREIRLDVEGQGGRNENISLPEYFQRNYNIQLRYPDLPGIQPNGPVPAGKKPEVYPLEVLLVMDDQRVSKEKTDPQLMDKLLRANSLAPAEKMKQIQQRAQSLGLFHDQNPVLKAFGISVDQKSNRIPIGVRRLPTIRFGTGTAQPDQAGKGDWRREGSRHAYLMPARELNNWLILCDQRNQNLVRQFASKMMEMAKQKRVPMGEPEVVPFRCSENNDRSWQDMFEECAREEIQFVMLVDNKRLDTHGLLKLYEARSGIVTQQVTLEKVMDIVNKNQRQTLENILNKLNMKNFGLNYAPQIEQAGQRYNLDSGEVLVIGYDVSHPAPMSGRDRRFLTSHGETQLNSLDPSVVGICANMATNPHAFVGDYFYQESRREALDNEQLSERMAWILHNLDEHRPKKNRPKYIFLLRDGLSEGQFAMACKDELEAIRVGCHRHDPSYKPKFLLAVGTKRHSKKFFAEGVDGNGRPTAENLQPGSVVQEGVVRADLTEFFLLPHAPIKGTAKPVEWAVLEDEIGVSNDELQSLIMSLCYSHQIVNMPVALPQPIYQAHELAKRGKNNFVAMKKHLPNEIPEREMGKPARNGNGAKKQSLKIVDYKKLGETLSYWDNGALSLACRFTA